MVKTAEVSLLINNYYYRIPRMLKIILPDTRAMYYYLHLTIIVYDEQWDGFWARGN